MRKLGESRTRWLFSFKLHSLVGPLFSVSTQVMVSISLISSFSVSTLRITMFWDEIVNFGILLASTFNLSSQLLLRMLLFTLCKTLVKGGNLWYLVKSSNFINCTEGKVRPAWENLQLIHFHNKVRNSSMISSLVEYFLTDCYIDFSINCQNALLEGQMPF